MMSRWLIPPLLAVAGFALGYLQENPAPSASKQGSEPDTTRTNSNLVLTPASAQSEEDRRLELRKQLKLASNEASRAHRVHEFFELFASLSLEDLRIAGKLINEVPYFCRDDAQTALTLRLLEIDPKEAAAFIKGREDEPSLAFALMTAWKRKDPDTAVLWFAENAASRGMTFQGSFLLREWPQSDLNHAVDLVLSAPQNFGTDALNILFSRLAADDPSTAMERAGTIANAKLRTVAMQAVMQGWAKKDSEAAIAWFDQLTDQSARRDFAVGLAVGLFAKDPDRAIDIASALPEGHERNAALAQLVESNRFGEKRAEALALLAKIPFESNNSKIGSIYSGWMYDDPGAAINHLLRRLDAPAIDPDERRAVEKFLNDPFVTLNSGSSVAKAVAAHGDDSLDKARGRLLEASTANWANKEPTQARDWALALPEGATQNRALVGAIQSWTWHSFSDAAAWLDQQPSSPSRDAATAGFVKAALSRDPAEVLTRARTINDEELRLSSLWEGWKNWSNRDRSAAEKWRDTTPDLTPKERAHLAIPAAN